MNALFGSVIGACIALVGVLVTQWLLEKRERLRLKEERDRARRDRLFNARQAAYVGFLTVCERVFEGAWDFHAYGWHGDPKKYQESRTSLDEHDGADPHSELAWQPLNKAREAVRVFGSDAACTAADEAMSALLKMADDSELVKEGAWEGLHEPVGKFLAAVRADLEVADL